MKYRRSTQSSQWLGRSERGFTLLELMFAIAVLGILLGLTVPTFREVIERNRIVAQNNEFVSSLNYARSEAIKRSDTVSVCASTTGTTCAGTTSWSTGWITFTDLNADGTLNGTDALLQRNAGTTGDDVAIDSPTLTFVRFSSSGMLVGTAGVFNLLKTGCTGLNKREIGVSVTGRVSTRKVSC